MESRYVLRARPPVRAFVLAAVLTLGGAALAVAASQFAWPGALVVLGIVLIVLGVALLGLAAAAAQRQEVTVVLDE
ncbi:MAG: hypothetical protein ACK5LS_06575, partial [Propioniciclava sp.]